MEVDLVNPWESTESCRATLWQSSAAGECCYVFPALLSYVYDNVSESVQHQPRVYEQGLVISMLQLPLMMIIITRLNCNTGVTLRLLNKHSFCRAAPSPISRPTKATFRPVNKRTAPRNGVPETGLQPVPVGLTGVNTPTTHRRDQGLGLHNEEEN